MSSSPLGNESSDSNCDTNAPDNPQQQDYGTTRDASSDRAEIVHPGPHDVLLGRGGGTNNHIGNKNFRDLVTRNKMRYLACSKVDKPKVARDVVNIWKKLEPPGRFLQRKDETIRGPGSVRDEDVVWIEVDDQEARKKASQCLRERTPDVQPILAQLREDDRHPSDAISLADRAILSRSGGNHPSATRGTSVGSILTDRTGADHMFRMSNQNAMLRRGSMPATVHSSTVGLVPGLPAPAQATMRRISLPPTSQYVPQQQQPPLDLIPSWQHQTQSDSYTAIERTTNTINNDINNINFLQGQVQQQILSNRESMMHHQRMAMRSATMMPTSQANPTMLDMGRPVVGMGMSMSPQQFQRNAIMAQAMGGEAQRLMQRQQLLLQQHQQLLAEQERLVRKEHMIASREVALAQQQQLLVDQMQQQPGFFGGPHAVTSTNLAGGKLGVPEWEPVPLAEEEEYTIPLAGEPDLQSSTNVVGAVSKRNTTTSSIKDIKVETVKSNDNIKRKKDDETGDKPSTGQKADGDEMSEQTLDPAPAALIEANDPQGTATEYRKLLDAYLNNHQNSIPSLGSHGDLDQDREEDEDRTIDGVTPSDWIEQQLLNEDSGDLSMSTRDRPKPPQRSSSKKSLMSLASSAEHMSFAFSEMDHFEDLSKEENKRSTNRSMSILSANTNMSELTDFDDLDCM